MKTQIVETALTKEQITSLQIPLPENVKIEQVDQIHIFIDRIKNTAKIGVQFVSE